MGAAKYAREKFGAKYGVGEGRTGEAYAIPTKDRNLRVIPLHEIGNAVHRFMRYARENPDLQFHVTPVGCGLAGYRREQIAPYFDSAPANCVFADENGKDWRNG